MKHIVQYSGGCGSAMAAYLVTQKQPKEDIILLFHDVKGGHDEDMYRFNADVILGWPQRQKMHRIAPTKQDILGLIMIRSKVNGGQKLSLTVKKSG